MNRGRPTLSNWATGGVAFLLLVANTLACCTVLFLLALVKLLVPLARVRAPLDRALNAVATCWVTGNGIWMRLARRTEWDIQGIADLDTSRWYIVACNHQSWVDIFVLQRLLNRRVPLLKFFLKRELLYVPVMGLAWWALDFPFMRRHSRRALRVDPKRGIDDAETSRRACAKFSRVPTSVMNFVEGTRITSRKQAAQASPYRHLLKPKTGALVASLETLGDKFTAMLDVTIVYPDGVPTFWEFLCGRVPRIVVRYRQVEIPSVAPGEHRSAAQVRASLAGWLSRVWAEKDAQIESLLASASFGPACSP